MLAPAPDALAFQPHPLAYKTPAIRKAATSEFKRTLIPILLTTSVMLGIMGSLKFILGEESPYSALPRWVIGTMFGTGGVLLALAVFTMMQVSEQLKRDAIR